MSNRFKWMLVLTGHVVVGVLVLALTSGCASMMVGGLGAMMNSKKVSDRKSDAPVKSQLEIRQLQQRDFETDDYELVFASMMNTLQDEGFIIRQAQSDVGLLHGSKSIDVADPGAVFGESFMSIMTGTQASYANNAELEVAANVSRLRGKGSIVRVRANFESKVYDNNGAVYDSEVVADENFYQEFFSKVSKGIFLEEEQL